MMLSKLKNIDNLRILFLSVLVFAQTSIADEQPSTDSATENFSTTQEYKKCIGAELPIYEFKDINNGKEITEKGQLSIPKGWTPIGGGSFRSSSRPFVVLCK